MAQEDMEVVRKAIEARKRDLEEWMAFFLECGAVTC
jgi:hypothetical protein